MKIARLRYQDNITYGLVEDKVIRIVESSIFDDILKLSNRSLSIEEARLLAPTEPSKVVCVGLNYKDHAKELAMPIPTEPIIFLKPSTSIIGPDDEIIYPAGVERLDYEAELAVVIRKRAKDVPPEEAGEYILGYTCLNDITARDLQKKDLQWTRAKSFDTFCPVGPYIVTDIDPSSLKIELRVNDNLRQSSSSANLIFNVEFLLSFISGIMTLLPGDIIATGTPPAVGALSKGDTVIVDIENIGSLRNRVV